MSAQATSSETIAKNLRNNGRHFDPDSGTLTLVYWAAQERAIEALDSGEHDIVVFRGGYGSGKSVLGARQTLEKARSHDNSDNLILAQDAAKGGPTTYKVFFKELPGEDTVPDQGGDPENSPWVADYNRNKSRLTLANGATIRLGSADKWNRYAGAEFNWIWADEVAHYETTDLYRLNKMLLSRQRTEAGPNVTLWTSTGNGYNQFYDFVERQVTPDGDPLPTRLKNIVADSRNNPFLSEKEKLERQFVGTAAEEQGLAGGFAAPEGLVYARFSREHHVVPEQRAAELAGDWRMYGYDHGWDDPRVVVEITRTPTDQYLIMDAYYRSETTVEDAIEWLDGKPDGTIYCEHEPAHIEKFKRGGWHAVQAEKSLDEGIPHVRGRLERDHEGQPGLLVSDACTNVIQEFLSYKEDHVGTSKATDHALDGTRYALFTHDQTPGVDDLGWGT